MKIKIGQVIIDSNDDPAIHKQVLENKYTVNCGYNRRMSLSIGRQVVTLSYHKRMLIGVAAIIHRDASSCWVDKVEEIVIPENEQVQGYVRKTNWRGILVKED